MNMFRKRLEGPIMLSGKFANSSFNNSFSQIECEMLFGLGSICILLLHGDIISFIIIDARLFGLNKV